ncbi:PQQ-dependent sugar dehydrogenase [Erythrobacter crassostreae]|uniref:PQQ-dependent sugar dehydrogenase n=1 Tax=Erythrobacter crassostreae TaxID=2828328 RepID=A0A9X1F3T0_9SPHN|nr:PQQ-dependent sugar dehydrogenase [Erythrobacter crassostrea]MBV7259446.1 PQQ-dependent sugar dehydrogenase [Erythrobacter crassostrea]
MTYISKAPLALSLSTLALASCANAEAGDSAAAASAEVELNIEPMGEFDRPWAIEFIPGSDTLAITEKAGTLKLMKTGTGEVTTVSGVPEVDYGGQGGFGDVAFLPSEANREDGRTIYLSWAEAGENDTRGAAVGRGTLVCNEDTDACAINDLKVIWRQGPKVTGKGHYSHRITFSPDEKYMFIASGDRQKLEPAQDRTNTLGSIVRLFPDGTIPTDNPMADEIEPNDEIWSYGHRNILGMDWDAQGRLWDMEHGPAGGDELNLVEAGANYGWPTRSYGKHYNGDPIPDHSADDGFNKPAIHWTPVIAPGDMIFYTGDMFGAWKGDALIAGLSSQAIVRVSIDGEKATETGRYAFDGRLRSIDEAPDGSIWVAEDGPEGRILKVSAQ